MIRVERTRVNLTWLWFGLALAIIAGALIVLPMLGAVAIVGGALALIALLRWPELGLYALIFAVPYGSWFPIPISVGNLTAVDLLVAVVIALWLARMIVQRRGIYIDWPPLAIPFAIFLFTAMLSMTAALSLQFAAKEFVKWAEMFAIYVFVANNLDAPKITRALIALVLAGLSEAAIGIYQFLFRVGPEGFALFGRFIRAYGTFEQPNPYAGYLGLIIPIVFGIVLGALFRRQKALDRDLSETRSLRLALFAVVSLAAMLAALGMSWSRGAWLGVAAGLVVTVIAQSRRAFAFSMAAALVLAFVIFLSSVNVIPNAIAARLSGIGDYFGVFDVRGVKVDDANFAIVERMAHWQAAWEMFSDHPLLGVGFGNYQVIYPVYALPHWSDPLGHAHNYYLNVAAEAGLIGLSAYAILWMAAFWQGWRAVSVSRGTWRGIAAGWLGVLVALSVHNGFDNLFVHGLHVQAGIGLGIAEAIWNSQFVTHKS